MLLENLLPQLPKTSFEIFVWVIALVGTILVIYSQFVEKENRRDEIRMIGALGLFIYAYSIFNVVFMIASGGIFLAAFIELIEILRGKHVHPLPPRQP
ncbi:MAG: hypothetical protein AAB408_00725 [Patescibacteria group bacterium]